MGAPAEVLGRTLSRAVGRRRMDLILEKPEAEALVQALPSEDLYLLVKEVGLDDATALVGLASPEQFQAFVDLDAWEPGEGAEHLDRARVLAWLAASRAGGAPTHRARWASLDFEVMELVLREGLRIVDKREEEEAPRPPPRGPEGETLQWFDTPDGTFQVAFTAGGPEGAELRRLLDDLYAENPFGAARLLSAIRWDLDSELEEHASRFRGGRLEDLGFPPPEVAASLYAAVDTEAPGPAQPRVVEPEAGFFLAEFRGGAFLDRAAEEVRGADARTQLDRSLMYLANQVMVADRVPPSEVDAVREAVGRMRAYLNLGLHHLAGGDPAVGGRILSETALKHVFQVGFTLTLRLRWRLDRLLDALGVEGPAFATRFDAPEREVLGALLFRRPRYGVALDAAENAGGAFTDAGREAAEGAPTADTAEGVRPFATPEDLARVSTILGRAEAWGRAAKAAGLLELPDPEGGPASLAVRATTAALAALLGRPFSPAALPVEDAARALELALDADGAATDMLLEALTSGLAAGGDRSAARPLAEEAAERLVAEAGPVVRAGASLDPALLTRVRTRD